MKNALWTAVATVEGFFWWVKITLNFLVPVDHLLSISYLKEQRKLHPQTAH